MAVIMIAFLMTVPAVGQTAASVAASTASGDAWTHPRTKWGHPDLQGLWTNETITGLVRI